MVNGKLMVPKQAVAPCFLDAAETADAIALAAQLRFATRR